MDLSEMRDAMKGGYFGNDIGLDEDQDTDCPFTTLPPELVQEIAGYVPKEALLMHINASSKAEPSGDLQSAQTEGLDAADRTV